MPAPLSTDLSAEIAALADRYRRANGPVMSLMTRLGGRVEDQMKLLPAGARTQVEAVTRRALERAHGLAAGGSRAPDLGPGGPVLAAALTGAAGGAGGLPTAIAELPVTITVILHAIRRAAEDQGFDPSDPAIRAECLQVFAAGSPLATDDGVNTSLIGARMALSGSAIQNIIATVAPRLAAVLGQKLAAQAVPVLGALAGAGLNAAFLSYYREIARIRFRLLALSAEHGADRVLPAFRAAATPPVITRN